jgi:hypothetical protein
MMTTVSTSEEIDIPVLLPHRSGVKVDRDIAEAV